DASTSPVSDAAQSDLVALNKGSIVLVAAGSVTLNDGSSNGGVAGLSGMAVSATGTASILIQATSGDLVVNSDVATGTGQITLKAAGNVLLGSATAVGVDVSTASTGTVSIDAEGGALTMAGDAWVIATDSSARLNAATTMTVGNVTAANVSLVADAGAILNAANSTKNVSANVLRLQADGAIGAADRHLTTAVSVLTARSNGNLGAGIYVSEDDAVTVGTAGVLAVELGSNGMTSAAADADQSDLVSLNNGHIVLVAG
ncbi:hypothetical protein, partial [Azohydromonas lata]|uniref:hypothetical protein n=1 Tax=Azohydromonas lata TaxID=45677 RepID=UPI000AE26658